MKKSKKKNKLKSNDNFYRDIMLRVIYNKQHPIHLTNLIRLTRTK